MEITEAERERDRFYYELHAAEIAERHRRWYRANREHALKRAKAYREAHADEIRSKQEAARHDPQHKRSERARWRRRMSLPGAREKRREQERKRRAIRAEHGWLYE